MRPWQRFGSAQRRTPGQQAHPFTPPEPRDRSLGVTTYQTSDLSQQPDPPQTPYWHHSDHHQGHYHYPHHHHPGPQYGPMYEPGPGPAGRPRPTPNPLGYARGRDGAFIPVYNDRAVPMPNTHHHRHHGHHHGHHPTGPPIPEYQGSFGQYPPPPPGYPPPPRRPSQPPQPQIPPNFGQYYPPPPLPPAPPGFYWAQQPPPYPPPPPPHHSPPPYTPHHNHYQYYPPPPPPRTPHRPQSRNHPRAYPHLPHWPPDFLPLSARENPRGTPLPVNRTPIQLHQRPEHQTFRSEAELRSRLTPIFRPMVGVIGRLVQTHLALPTQPRVKFDLYPVQVDASGSSPAIRWRTLSRAPIYTITLPGTGTTERRLQDASDALKDTLAGYPNPWFRQAGYVFRISRGARLDFGDERVRVWVPPLCVYRYSRSGQAYRALFIEVSEEMVEEVDGFHDYGDTSEDDQEQLVNEMWEDVRRSTSRGPQGSPPSMEIYSFGS